MNIKPVNGRILLKKIVKNNKILSGIIIPETNKEITSEGIIIELNSDNIITKSEFKIGDRVLFNKYSGQDLKINDEELILIKKEDIIAIIN